MGVGQASNAPPEAVTTDNNVTAASNPPLGPEPAQASNHSSVTQDNSVRTIAAPSAASNATIVAGKKGRSKSVRTNATTIAGKKASKPRGAPSVAPTIGPNVAPTTAPSVAPIAAPKLEGVAHPNVAPTAASSHVTAASTRTEQIHILQNIHNTTMYMQEKCGPPLPPNLVETNNILRDLMGIAEQVTAGKQYDWKKVAQQLGLIQGEGYMNFMNSIDEAKKICGFNESAQDAAPAAPAEEGGTQQSEVGSTHIEFNKQK
ncbi:hypothetical protein SESBI_50159 [Sesbania bispinosa]|nr:hypothetical protein SESBI_50159 [Sesbania bispinosa]